VENSGLDLRRLRYFIAVCESGGFSRASSAIGIAQPALTRQVKLLESEIGLPLINRTARGAEPTEEGRFLLARSREHINGLDRLVREIRQKFSTLNGPVVLGICPSIAPFFLDDLLAHAREIHPNLALTVIQAYSGDLQNLMASGKLDVALTYLPSTRKGIECTELFSEPLVLVAGLSPTIGDRPGSGDTAGMKLVLPSRIHELRRIIDSVHRSRGTELVPDLELDSLEAVKALLMAGSERFSTILPFYSVRREIEQGLLSCVPFEDPRMRRTIAIVRPVKARNYLGASALAAFVEARAEALKADLQLAG
jgi:DNA-binding transcriptional LysR family regulator